MSFAAAGGVGEEGVVRGLDMLPLGPAHQFHLGQQVPDLDGGEPADEAAVLRPAPAALAVAFYRGAHVGVQGVDFQVKVSLGVRSHVGGYGDGKSHYNYGYAGLS